MNIISLNPSYIPLMQKRFCCAAAVLQMIVYRNGYGLFDQEEVARELGVKISAEDISAFSKPMPLFTKLNFDEGLKTVESEEVINQFFKNHSIALCARAVRSQNVPSMEEFLKDNILGNRDIWVEYHNDETRDSTIVIPNNVYTKLIIE